MSMTAVLMLLAADACFAYQLRTQPSRARQLMMTSRAAFSTVDVSRVEQCILDAKSEDEVQACLQIEDEEHFVSEATLKTLSDDLESLDECILHATSEDEVQACMQLSDEGVWDEAEKEAPSNNITSLGSCLQSAKSKAAIEECVLAHGTASENSYG